MSARRALALALVLTAVGAHAHADVTPGALTREAVEAAVRDRLDDVKACYRKAATRKPWLAGRVVMSFTIDGAGRVTRVELARAELPDARFLACAQDAVAAWRFPRAPGDPVDFSYPIIFGGGRGDDPSVLVDGKPRPVTLPARCKLAQECRELGASLARGGEDDQARAFGYFETGCALKDGASCAGAAAALDFGRGVAKDKRRAYALARRACALHDQHACTMVAMTLALGGEGVAKDPVKASAMLEGACAAGEAAACLNLAERRRLGLGVARDEDASRALRRRELERAD